MANAIYAAALALLPVVVSMPTATSAQQTVSAHARDLAGIWMNDNSLDERLKREGRNRLDPSETEPQAESAPPPLTPEYMAIFQKLQEERAKMEEGAEACTWVGLPRIMGYPYPVEILQTPQQITMIFEADSQVRRIFLNRTEHLPYDDLDPTYYGDSIGRWEGDELYVHTIGFNDTTLVGRGWPHSEDMVVEERWKQVKPGVLEVHMKITDPKAFTKPIEQTITYSRRPDWRIREYSCLENNRDAPDKSGMRSGGVVE
jgi:hypothetical protein